MIDPHLKASIDSMTQEEMARLWRYAPAGSAYFEGEVGRYFEQVFMDRGGMTPTISKKIGWDK